MVLVECHQSIQRTGLPKQTIEWLKSRAWLKTTNGLVTDDNPSQFQKHAAYLINSCRRTHSAVFGGSNDYSLLVSSMQNFKNVTAVRVFFFSRAPFSIKNIIINSIITIQ